VVGAAVDEVEVLLDDVVVGAAVVVVVGWVVVVVGALVVVVEDDDELVVLVDVEVVVVVVPLSSLLAIRARATPPASTSTKSTITAMPSGDFHTDARGAAASAGGTAGPGGTPVAM
jgi:hypothetical protein